MTKLYKIEIRGTTDDAAATERELQAFCELQRERGRAVGTIRFTEQRSVQKVALTDDEKQAQAATIRAALRDSLAALDAKRIAEVADEKARLAAIEAERLAREAADAAERERQRLEDEARALEGEPKL